MAYENVHAIICKTYFDFFVKAETALVICKWVPKETVKETRKN